MIFITYCTQEMLEIDRSSLRRKYEICNDFLSKISFNGNFSVPNSDVSTITSTINKDFEQIYYETVMWGYKKEIDSSEMLSKWDELFKYIDFILENKRNELIKSFSGGKESPSNRKKLLDISNKVIVVNMSHNLGPWQSMEVLISIKHNADVYWIGIDTFISLIKRIISNNNKSIEDLRLLFSKKLFNKATKVN